MGSMSVDVTCHESVHERCHTFQDVLVLLSDNPSAIGVDRGYHRTTYFHHGAGDRNRRCWAASRDRAGRGRVERQASQGGRAYGACCWRNQCGPGHHGSRGQLGSSTPPTLSRRPVLADPRTVEIVAGRGCRASATWNAMAWPWPEDGRISSSARTSIGGPRSRRLHRSGDPAHAYPARGAAERSGARRCLHHPASGPRRRRLRCLRLRSHPWNAVPDPRRRRHPCRWWSHPASGGERPPGATRSTAIPSAWRWRPEPVATPSWCSSILPGSSSRRTQPEPWSARPPEVRAASCATRSASRFVNRWACMELSTRDRVAFTSYTEIEEGRGTTEGEWLDVSHLPRQTIMTRLPGLPDPARSADAGHHPRSDRDRAHRTIRWVRCWVRTKDHRTDVRGLYAIGEASSGLHGANRLGGNSLIELLVFGVPRAGRPPPTRSP